MSIVGGTPIATLVGFLGSPGTSDLSLSVRIP
jgi:hypothetical protein